MNPLFFAFLIGVLTPAPAPCAGENRPSGGPLHPEQAAYDVLYYGLVLEVDPKTKSIAGSLEMRARVEAETRAIALDLDDRLGVSAVRLDGSEVEFSHEDGRIRITCDAGFGALGDEFSVTVDYAGKPRVAPRPPWEGGFTWSVTKAGAPWIATSCQGSGADLWWPCKDHPSDEPDTMDLSITVPADLFVASNGRLRAVEQQGTDKKTYHWHVSTPINNYGVALNIAPYVGIEQEYTSVTGESMPFTYWVLPENEEQGRAIVPEFLAHLRFFEELFGPYPFRADKYGVVETPHLGMEHQSIIAYGNGYRKDRWGFDWLHHHELAHEWWANLVTARDWKDFWIHEGFATYAQALYAERLSGPEAYRGYMKTFARFNDERPVAPRTSKRTDEMYFVESGAHDNDIYYKGAWILHSLRFLVGDEVFFQALRRMAYPTPELEATTDGSACRFVDTEDFRVLVEELSGRDLGWFFEVYLRSAERPELLYRVEGKSLVLSWKTPGDLPFPMPVELEVGEARHRIEMKGSQVRVPLLSDDFVIDPDRWLLKK